MDQISGQDDSKLLDMTRQHSEALAECMLELFALYHLSKALNVSFQMDAIFGEAESLMKNLLGISKFCVMLLDDSSKTLKMWKANKSTYEAAKEVTFKLGEGVCGKVAETGEPALVPDVSKEKDFMFYKGKKTKIGSFYSTPLKTRQGKIIGVLNIHKEDANAFSEKRVLVYNAVAMHIAHALENSMLFQETQKQAITDELTKLYSRRYFMEILRKEISKAKRNAATFSLVMFDVDRFKSVNDTFGHLVGDDVLRKLSHELSANTRQEDVLARYGGEEFIVMLPGINVRDAMFVAEKLRNAVKKNVSVDVDGKSSRHITISGGVSCYPECGCSIEEIIDSADKALYAAKHNGRDKICCAPANKQGS